MARDSQSRSQADSRALYSGAQSFLSFLEKGVDPRTGIYSIRVSLPEIAMNALAGPDLKLSLGFDPLQNVDVGLGRGWSWGTSRLTPDARRLVLSDGETHVAVVHDDRIELPDKKLPTFMTTRTGNRVRVTYRSGREEILEAFDLSDPSTPFVPVEILSPEGRSLYYEWTYFEGQAALAGVFDHERRERVRIVRDERAVTISVAGDNGQTIEFVLTLTGDLVTAIRLPVQEQASWQLAYQNFTDARLACLSSVISPSGGMELITYEEDGLAFPPRPDMPDTETTYLPCVSRHQMNPGSGQPIRTTHYRYSTNNFLGFGAGVDWEDATDALYKIREDYRYDSTETHVDDDGQALVSIYREYDRFHNLRVERRTQGDHVIETLDEFHDEAGKNWYEQPTTVGLTRTRTVRYRRGGLSRDEVTTYRYDAWGNTIETIGPDGIAERTTYYDPAGEPGCPPDPLWTTPRTPKATVIEPEPLDARVLAKTTRYQYALLPSLRPEDTPSLVCVSQTLQTREGDHESTTFEYENNPLSALLHARVRTRVDAMGGREMTADFAYDLVGDVLVTDRSFHTNFDLAVTHTITHTSALSGLELRRENADAILTYAHDALGRVVTETVAPATGDDAFVATLTHDYRLAAAPGLAVSHAVTDASGVVVMQTFDGVGRLVRETRLVPDIAQGQAHDTLVRGYDSLGNLVREIAGDFHDGAPVAVERTFRYDDWGRQAAVVRADGVTEHTEYDPITREERSWLSSDGGETGVVRRVRNRFDEVEVEERYTLDGKLVSRRTCEFDGLGRLIGAVDTMPSTRRVTHDYDVIDRRRSTTLPDDTVVTYEYAPHSHDDDVVAVKVNGVSVGQRTFDGLMRVVSRTIGGRTATWAYDGDRRHPREERTADGAVLTFDVHPSLPDNMQRRVSGDESVSYAYDAKTGLLSEARIESNASGFSTYRCERYASGDSRDETWTDEDTQHSVHHVWTLQGLPERYTDATGKVHVCRYDPSTGRLVEARCEDVSVAIEYDALGRAYRQRVTQGGQAKLTTTLFYDDVGREIRREFEAPEQPVFAITHAYDGVDQVSRRERIVGDQVELSETFAYDARARLDLYYAFGPQAPHDPHDPSRRIEMQQWEHDRLDNVTRISTWHQGSDQPASTATYGYDNPLDPTQLTSLERSLYGGADERLTFRYDAGGRMVEAEQGFDVAYDPLDRVLSVSQDGEQRASYGYNALDEQSRIVVAGEPERQRVFREQRLATQIRGVMSRSYLTGGLGDVDEAGGLNVYATDHKASVMRVHGGEAVPLVAAYSPSGYRASPSGLDGVPGMDGEAVDPATQWLWLGNVRMYSPVLARFMVPDAMSPFNGGGFNSYARYDPVNSTDASGQSFKFWTVFVALSVAVTGIGAAVFLAGGIAGAGAALRVAGTAVAAKAGLTSTSAAALATANATTVISAFATSGKLVLGTTGSMLTATATGFRVAGNTDLATKLSIAGGTLSALGVLASTPDVVRTYRTKVAARLKANQTARAARQGQDEVVDAAPAPDNAPSPRSSRTNSLSRSGSGRPQMPGARSSAAWATSVGPGGGEAASGSRQFAQDASRVAPDDRAGAGAGPSLGFGFARLSGVRPQSLRASGGGGPRADVPAVVDASNTIRRFNKLHRELSTTVYGEV